MSPNVTKISRTAQCLWLLLGLFTLRVFGQLLVETLHPRFLPASPEWYSGAITYRPLLLTQVILILVHTKVCIDFTRRRGWFYIRKRWLGWLLVGWGSTYLAVMVVRYTVRMSLYPLERWTGGSIPIFLHWVLAAFVLVVGYYHWSTTVSRSTARHWMTRFGIVCVALVTTTAGICTGLYFLAPSLLAWQLGIRPPQFAVRPEYSKTFTTDDGIRLAAEIYHPQRSPARTPTILVRIPYSKTWRNQLFSSVVGRMWAERGYTTVIQGTRGRYESTGDYYPLRHEAADGAATLCWLSEQPWFDGQIGTWGGSYFGYTQWAMSDWRKPALSAMLIQEASTDFYEMFYPGGAFSLESALYWSLMSSGHRDIPPSLSALDRGASGQPLIEADDRAGQDVGFFNDWVRHDQRDDYWQQIDGNDRAQRLASPVMLMAGWYDPFLPTQLADYQRIEREAAPEVKAKCRLVIGPWTHADVIPLPNGYVPRNYRLESLAPSIAWFDQHLGNLPSEVGAPVRIFVMGKNEWRDEREWPLARAESKAWYLRSGGNANSAAGDGRLESAAPELIEPPDRFQYDPRRPVPSAGGTMLGPRAGIALQNSVEQRDDILVYTSLPLEADTEITGPIKVILYVETSAPRTDFTAKLVDVWPNGLAYNISDGILRRSYPAMSQQERAPQQIEIQLWPTSTVVSARHRLRLEISSSNFPRFDANPNTDRPVAEETASQPASQVVFHQPDLPSALILPIIPSQPSTNDSP